MEHEGTRREKRWAVITQDGRHSWVGRHTDPDAEDIDRLVSQLEAQGMTGWLTVTEGVYYEPNHTMSAVMVRPLAGQGDWETAWSEFLAKRESALKP